MKILIAEDDAATRHLLESLLTDLGFQVLSAADGDEAWHILSQPARPRLAVLDWMMPGIEGDEICRRVRQREGEEGEDEGYTYLILLTAKGSTDHVVNGLDAGADDYIAKPFDEHELRARVRAGQRIVRLHSELLEAKNDLLVQARTDSLTGVLNRRAILRQIEIELGRAKRGNEPVSLSVIDIDNFKNINDTHGHAAGDAILVEFVNRIREVIRIYDSFGRMGGEEFCVLFPGTRETEALAICTRIREVLAEKPIDFQGEPIHVTASQGITASHGEETVDDLINLADQAMYRAKRKGRNRVEPALSGESDG